jgi:hypothetical protein
VKVFELKLFGHWEHLLDLSNVTVEDANALFGIEIPDANTQVV